MALHAKLSASKAERWINCPGSVLLGERFETDESATSVYAKEGTVAHELCRLALTEPGVELRDYLGSKMDGVTVTQSMVDHLQPYVTEVRLLMEECRDHQIEKKVSFRAPGVPVPSELSGTPDFCGIDSAGWLTVVDLKYGAGVLVDVTDWQFRAYAIYYMTQMASKRTIKGVSCLVYQPRVENDEGPWRNVLYTLDEIKKFANDLVTAAWATVQPQAPLKPGDHCRFCPAAPRCPALLEKTKEVTVELFEKQEPRDVTTLTDEQLVQVIHLAPVIKKWLAAVETHALDEVVKGHPLPGLKLVAKNTHRRWSNPDEVEAAMIEHGIPEDTLFEKKLKTPAAVERLLGKQKALVAPLTYKPLAVTLVSATDPRPEMQTTPEMFADTEPNSE